MLELRSAERGNWHVGFDVRAWLEEIGLGEYAPQFAAHAIDGDILAALTDEHLKELGLPLGDRLRLLRAIADRCAGRGAPGREADGPSPDAERRHLTIMFVDLVGSTVLSARLDPEELREVIRAYHETVTAEIGRFQGHVAKLMGDGVLAYFGWPKAHEDEAERAVRAGLAVVEAVGRLATPAVQALSARIGVATGLVVVGDLIGEGEAAERAVVGETPNLAARLQALAAPGSVVIAEATRRLLGSLFVLEDLGRHPVKGFGQPVEAFRVVGEGTTEGRFEARHGHTVLSLVGREQELALLLDRWALAKSGEGQIVLLEGEAGIGKSRVTLALREALRQEPRTSLRYFCSAHHANSTLHPFIAQLERAAGLGRDDPREAKLDKLEALLGEATSDVGEAASLLAELLGIGSDGRHPAMDLTPQQKKARTFAALLAQLEGLAAKQPMLLLLEDAHWLDPTSLELFGLVADRIEHLPVLLVVTYRPDSTPPWRGYPHVTSLTLNRLGWRQARALVDRLTGGRRLPDEVLEPILAKTDGVPLFIEELTKTVLESGIVREADDGYALTGPLPPFAIPASLHDSLMARLDRLAPIKEIAQIGACLGREFDHALLAAVVGMQAAKLEHALDELVRAELVFRRGTPPAATYRFKHALVQDAAYASLLKSRRVVLHARIAAALEDRFADLVERQPEQLAYHLTEAGLAERAIDFWLKAGHNASGRSGHREAIGHLSRALALLETLPASDQRTARELEVQIALGVPLIATRGFAAPEVEATYSRAEHLARDLKHMRHLATSLRGLCYAHHVRARFQRKDELSAELLGLAGRTEDMLMLADAHNARAFNLFHLGQHAPAREHLEQGAEMLRRLGDLDHAFSLGVNIGVFAKAYSGHCLWHLGQPDRALEAVQSAIGLADRLAHPFSLAVALAYAAMLHQFRREASRVRERAEAALAVSTEHGFSYYRAWAEILLGWATAEEGETETGIGLVRDGIRDLHATGAELRLPHYLGILAALHLRSGQLEEASEAVREALSVAGRTGECWGDPRLHVLEGDLLLATSRDAAPAAEARFRHAVKLAVDQEARSLILQATMRLARLLAEQGRRSEARDELAPAYALFAEGFETPDLEEARALLGTLR
jgi:class 3 adenylate cyclase/predicted ATPase